MTDIFKERVDGALSAKESTKIELSILVRDLYDALINSWDCFDASQESIGDLQHELVVSEDKRLELIDQIHFILSNFSSPEERLIDIAKLTKLFKQ